MTRVVPLHLWGAKTGSFFFIIFSLILFSISSLNPSLLEGARTKTTDLFGPVLSAVNRPFFRAAEYVRAVSGVASLQAENARLLQENDRLRDWYQTALTLQEENENLQKLLNIKIEPAHRFVSAHIIADSGNSFAKSLLVLAGSESGVESGQAVLAGDGLVGRIIESGRKTARILLLTDMNSRIPVLIPGMEQRAILAGNNSDIPTLLHLPPEIKIEEGARVITSGHGGLFPYGLPVGRVIKAEDGTFAIQPYAVIDRVNMVRIINKADDYNLIPAQGQALP
ncbi:MAG: rod shape-determining protein MreC [Alphaproteobacteria bacterium CG_4_9_14_3_um_filter_47_13]|nr:MAG: rod shape-determining protein MreC [Alphaproteobacteria bacterium CG_4_9_14_3_um_filter_47_13]